MSPSAWIAFGSLAFAFLVQTAAIAFWAGRMSQRVLGVEQGLANRSELNDKVTRLCVEQEATNKSLEKMTREMEGVHRQLGNIAMKQIGFSGEMT